MSLDRTTARQLAHESLAQGDALGWFNRLYVQAEGNERIVPWADMEVNPNLRQWLERDGLSGNGMAALVIGCGLGDDAEALAAIGFKVTAFDISSTAIDWCRKRFANSFVDYVVHDLFAPPSSWSAAFDFVLEAYTLQVLPPELRPKACEQIAGFVDCDGTLLVISRGRRPEDDAGQMPWPLVRSELYEFGKCGLSEVSFDDYFDDEQPPVRRFRVEYRRKRLITDSSTAI